MDPEAPPGKVSRRQVLRILGLAAFGTVLVLGSRRMEAVAYPPPSTQAGAKTAPSSSAPAGTAPSPAAPASTSSTSTASAVEPQPSSQEITVKVEYFQMPLVVTTSVEHFSLASPARYSDLLALVVQEHPAISTMLPSMMILIDGVPATPGAPLSDGDEVDFIPAIAGG